MTEISNNNPLIEFYSDDTHVKLSVRVDAKDETVWLNLNQIAQLFERDKSVISRYLRKIYKASELDKKSTAAFLQQFRKRVVIKMISHHSDFLDCIRPLIQRSKVEW